MGTSILGQMHMSRAQAVGMGIDIEMDPSPVLLVQQFNALGADIRSFKEPLHRSIKQVMTESLRKNFDAEGRPDAWQPLAESTLRAKAHQGWPSDILVQDGSLKRAAGQINIWDINGQEGIATMSIPESVWYGIVHQEGAGESFEGGVLVKTGKGVAQTKTKTFGSKGYVPQRVWALFQYEDIDRIEEIFDEWLQERLVRAGFV